MPDVLSDPLHLIPRDRIFPQGYLTVSKLQRPLYPPTRTLVPGIKGPLRPLPGLHAWLAREALPSPEPSLQLCTEPYHVQEFLFLSVASAVSMCDFKQPLTLVVLRDVWSPGKLEL